MRHLISFIILFFSCISLSANANKVTVTGTVTDSDGQPLTGALVSVAGSAATAATDIDGKFLLADIPVGSVLQASFIGYAPAEVSVVEGTTVYPMVLEVNHSVLDEVVVVGYATQKKVNLTGSVASISKDAFSDRPVTNVTNALAGLASGMTVTNSGGNTPGYESQSIRVRGQGTLNDAAPLVVVDGMTGIALSDINPQAIAN